MLVIEHRHGSATRAKNLENFLEETVPRIFRLAHFVARIIPVLAHHHDAVNGEFSGAERQRLGNAGINCHAGKTPRAVPAQITRAHLVDIERDQIHRRMMKFAAPAIALEEAVDDVLGV